MTTQADSFCLSVYKCTDAFFDSASASHPLTAIGVTNKTNKLPVLTCWLVRLFRTSISRRQPLLTCWLADIPPALIYRGRGGPYPQRIDCTYARFRADNRDGNKKRPPESPKERDATDWRDCFEWPHTSTGATGERKQIITPYEDTFSTFSTFSTPSRTNA